MSLFTRSNGGRDYVPNFGADTSKKDAEENAANQVVLENFCKEMTNEWKGRGIPYQLRRIGRQSYVIESIFKEKQPPSTLQVGQSIWNLPDDEDVLIQALMAEGKARLHKRVLEKWLPEGSANDSETTLAEPEQQNSEEETIIKLEESLMTNPAVVATLSKEDLHALLKKVAADINATWVAEKGEYRVHVAFNNKLIIYRADSLAEQPKEDVLQFGTTLKSTLTPDQEKLQELVANTKIRTSKQAEQAWRDAAKQVAEYLDEKAGKPFQYFSLKATSDRVEPEQLIPAVITGILDKLEDETCYSIVDDRLVMTSNAGSFVIEAEAFVKMPPIWNPESSQFVYGPGVSESPSDSAKQIIEKSLPVLRSKIPAKLHEKLVQWCQTTTSNDYINALRTQKQAKYPSADELVFLGGTVASNWREDFCRMIHVPYFNPVVDDWNSKAQATEERMKNEASVLLYAITAKHTGFYSFVEMTASAFQNPYKTIVIAFLEHDGPFTGASRTSNNAIAEMLGKLPNVKVFFSRVKAAAYINSRKDEVIEQN